jgi:hypothetical protein
MIPMCRIKENVGKHPLYGDGRKKHGDFFVSKGYYNLPMYGTIPYDIKFERCKTPMELIDWVLQLRGNVHINMFDVSKFIKTTIEIMEVDVPLNVFPLVLKECSTPEELICWMYGNLIQVKHQMDLIRDYCDEHNFYDCQFKSK